jgi:A/G-specific adenine glycosylase
MVNGLVRHTFSHFYLELQVLGARIGATEGIDGIWCPPNTFGDYALPTVMKKVVRIGAGFL